ncbi:MAG: histidinol-phosphate transaminase [Nitrospirota bacterium]
MKNIKKLIRKEVLGLKAYEVKDIPAKIRLDAKENPFPLPPEFKKSVLNEAEGILLNRYPDSKLHDLRKVISSQLNVKEDEIMIGNGSDELIQMIVTAFGGFPERFLYSVPTFSMYGIIARAQGQQVIEIPLNENFDLDVEKIIAAVKKKRPRVIFISYPNNPTGNCFSEDRILKIIKECRGGMHSAPTVVVVDEAYYNFSKKSFIPYLKKYKNLMILRSLSKIGLAGLRVGILIADKGIVSELNKVRLPYNLNSYSQVIARFVLENRGPIDEQIDIIISERERMMEEMKGISGTRAYPSDSNFIFFKVKNAERVYKGLIDRGILIRNVNGKGHLKDALQVTIGTPDENMEFLKALRELV